MQLTNTMLLAGCAAGLSCSLITGTVTADHGQARTMLAQATTEKASPFAAAKDETNAPEGADAVQDGLKELAGSKAAGTKKNSPFAAAKETDNAAHLNLRADRARLWWLLVPVGFAAISYGSLRSQEGGSGA